MKLQKVKVCWVKSNDCLSTWNRIKRHEKVKFPCWSSGLMMRWLSIRLVDWLNVLQGQFSHVLSGSFPILDTLSQSTSLPSSSLPFPLFLRGWFNCNGWVSHGLEFLITSLDHDWEKFCSLISLLTQDTKLKRWTNEDHRANKSATAHLKVLLLDFCLSFDTSPQRDLLSSIMLNCYISSITNYQNTVDMYKKQSITHSKVAIFRVFQFEGRTKNVSCCGEGVINDCVSDV